MQFDAYLTRDEPLDGLWVQAGTLGRTHTFELPGGTICVSLPSSTDDNAVAQRQTLVEQPGDPEHTWFEVLGVFIRLDPKRPVRFEGTDANFNTLEVHRSAPAQSAIDAMLQTIEDALDLWKRTLRWIALAPTISFADIRTPFDAARGRGFTVFRKVDDAVFRAHGGTFHVPGGGKVTSQAWNMAGELLKDGVHPPVWIDYAMEAHRRRGVGDLRATIVNAAIAIETVVRAVFLSTFEPVRSPVATRILDTTSVQSLLSRWDEISGWDKATAKKRGKSQVHDVLELRNAVMHEGLASRDRLGKISVLLPRATNFVLACDAHLAAASGSQVRITPAEGAERRISR